MIELEQNLNHNKMEKEKPLTGEEAKLALKVVQERFYKLSKNERDAICAYSDDMYIYVNGMMRDEQFKPSDEYMEKAARDVLKDVSSAMQKCYIPKDIFAYRGVSRKAFEGFENSTGEQLIGKTFHDKGFMSTSLDFYRAKTFQKNSDGVILRLKVPAGTNGILVHGDLCRWLADEDEVCLDRGQKYIITGVDKNDKKIFDCEIIPQKDSKKLMPSTKEINEEIEIAKLPVDDNDDLFLPDDIKF